MISLPKCIFAILFFCADSLLAGLWMIEVFVDRYLHSPYVREWLEDPASRRLTFWQVISVDDTRIPALVISGVLPSLLFAWAMTRGALPVQLGLILRRSAYASLWMFVPILILFWPLSSNPEKDTRMNDLGWVLTQSVFSCIPAGLMSGWVLYRYLKIMERRGAEPGLALHG